MFIKYRREQTGLYVEARNGVKEVVKAAEIESSEVFDRNIEENYRANQKRFWSFLKGLRKT